MSDTPVRLFISYSRADSDFVDKLQADLQARNFDAWVDRRKIEGGRDWAEMIERAIDRCQVIVVVLSPDALASEWVRKEYSYAQDTRKPVLPLQFKSTAKIPLRLSELQRINFEASYEQGMRDLLIALTPITIAPPPPIPNAPPPFVESEDSSDLVEIRPAPQAPNSDLEALYRAGLESSIDGDLERAAILWGQILEQDPNFHNGSLKTQMEALAQNLRPIRIQRLRDRAKSAMENQDWRQAAGAWSALLDLAPDDLQAVQGVRSALRNRAEKAHSDGFWGEEIGAWEALLKLEPKNTDAKELLAVAEQNQQWEFTYKSAQDFAQASKLAAAKAELELLWSNAPYYGDPAHIAATVGVVVPPDYAAMKAAKLHEEQEREAARVQAEREKQETERQQREHEDKISQLRATAEQHYQDGALSNEIAAWKNLLELDPSDSQALGALEIAEYRKAHGDKAYFIHDDLGTSPYLIFACTLALLVGAGGLVGAFTQTWNVAVGVVLGIGILSYLTALRKVYGVGMMLLALLIGGGLVFALVSHLSSLQYGHVNVTQVWGFGTRHQWLGRQLAFGVAAGLVCSYFLIMAASDEGIEGFFAVLTEDSIFLGLLGIGLTMLMVWPFLAAIATLLGDWGFGFGYGWDFSLLVGCALTFSTAIGIMSLLAIVATKQTVPRQNLFAQLRSRFE